VARALAEDVGSGDVTVECVLPKGAVAAARIVQKEEGVLFGLEAAAEAFRQTGAGELSAAAEEAIWRAEAPAHVARIEGPAGAILTAERTALNFLGRLSGIATLTHRYVRAVEGSGACILDTRKTTPGLRVLEKRAVAAGGGQNHRMGLHDAVLIKENHAAVAGGVGEAVRRALRSRSGMEIEVECRTLEEVREALAAGASRLLLDNMSPAELRQAVGLRAGGVALEASGGVTLENVAEVAETGVDFISVGALTHSAPALDFSLLVEPAS
jgi:nicotinate-nucleotide pyrophosphorylase (carboxylating)